MNHRFKNTVVIALGGSLMCPNGVDYRFLKNFKHFINPFLKKGIKFILVVGGGKIAREYQEAASHVVRVTDDDKDWIGIHATRLNAHLVRTVFRDVADPVIIDARHKVRKLVYPITVASGWRPGWSTDYIAIALAVDFKIPEAVIAGKPEYVYDKDNAKYADAKPMPEMNWSRYKKLIPAKWTPGTHAPVDPVAARLAAQKGVAAIVIGGRDLKNFSALLQGKDFRGTIIR